MKKVFVSCAIVYLLVLVILMVGSLLFFTEAAFQQNVDLILVGPGRDHWFGTDSLGRDLLARVLVGGRISLSIGVFCAALTFFIGFAVGAMAGWFEGVVDRVIMRICDVLTALPSFVLVSILCLTLQRVLSFENPHIAAVVGLCVGISATHWMGLARVTRGLVLEIKRRPFVEAAVALGGTRSHILWRHIFPNMRNTLLILVALQIPTSILYESFMSFIGFGVHPPYTSWGLLLREGWKTLSTFPHLLLFPSLVLFLTVWSFHLILDSFKDLPND